MSKIDPLITLPQITCSWHYFKDNKNKYSNYMSFNLASTVLFSNVVQKLGKYMTNSSKLLMASSNFSENIFHLIKIVHLQIIFYGATLYWDREINWPVLTSIKKPCIPSRVKNRTLAITCSMKNNTKKDNLKSSIIKVETFLKRTFASWKIRKTQGGNSR